MKKLQGAALLADGCNAGAFLARVSTRYESVVTVAVQRVFYGTNGCSAAKVLRQQSRCELLDERNKWDESMRPETEHVSWNRWGDGSVDLRAQRSRPLSASGAAAGNCSLTRARKRGHDA